MYLKSLENEIEYIAHAFYVLWPAKGEKKEREKICLANIIDFWAKPLMKTIPFTWFCQYHQDMI